MEIKKDKLYIVMPTYNEADNITNVIEDWYPILEKYGTDESKLVISDGGSTDNTLDILYDLKKKYTKLEIIPKPGTDHGTKVILLYKYAINDGAEWIFQTDSDGQTDCTEFEQFWNLKDSYDCILGNRTKRGDGFFRYMIELVLRIYVLIFFGVIVPDANAPFRLMKSNVVKKYIDLFDETFSLPNAILSASFSKYKERVMYIPISFLPRQGGTNYINVKRIAKYGLESIKSFWDIKCKMKDYKNEK